MGAPAKAVLDGRAVHGESRRANPVSLLAVTVIKRLDLSAPIPWCTSAVTARGVGRLADGLTVALLSRKSSGNARDDIA